MALPSGYKRMEYIRSTGTQYVDSGFAPNQNTRVLLDFEPTASYSSIVGIFGTRDENSGTSKNQFVFWNSGASTFRTDYFGTQKTMSVPTLLARQIVDKNKNITTIGSVSATNTVSTGQCANNLYLFCANSAGTANYFSKLKLYSCRIYDNGTLIRDYIPCQTTAGEIGLWDDVNSVFYGNAGTGTFTAGPVIEPPAAPTGLQQSIAVRIAWTAVSGATRYNVYRDGSLIGSTTETSYVDAAAAENTEYTYGVSAVGTGGESAKSTITVYTKSGYFIYKPFVESATFQ